MFDRELSLLWETTTPPVMSSDIIYLNDFVDPVPICQPSADLGSILSIFQHLNCKFLAIPQEATHWGVVYAEDLLGLLVAAWQGSTNSVVSHLRHMAPQAAMGNSSTWELQSIIKPAQIYRAEMKLEEFLSQIEHDAIFSDRGECLVVNAAGELKGSLDREKIIQFLASKSTYSSPQSPQLDPSLSHLLQLTETIALPLKIETASGQELYRNQLWQEQVSSDRYITPACQTTPPQLAGGELQYQLGSNDLQLAPQSLRTDYRLRAQTQNRGLLSATELINSDPGINNYLSHQQPLNLSNLPGSFEPESSCHWNYLKIPLTLGQRATELDPYYLIIATPVVVAPSVPSTEPCCLNGVNEVTSNLLTSISHELKSPLTGIVGLSNLLQEQKLGQLNQRQARYIKLIHGSGQTMMGIIDDLLQLTRLTSEAKEPELVNLELLCRQIYQEAIAKVYGTGNQDFETVAIAADLQLEIELGSELALTNEPLLSCILSHLILSAIQVHDSRPAIAINISNSLGLTAFTINYHLPDLGTKLSSSAPETLNSLRHEWGLNLIIAEYLATVLEGSISQLAAQDSGQFTLLIPKNHHPPSQLANNPHSTPVTEQQTENQNLTILCLYPEPDAIDCTARKLNNSNFNLKSWIDNQEQQNNYQHRIIEADSLEQAHTLARIWRFDVIILDSYQLIQPGNYLSSLLESEDLSVLPLITLDTRTTEAANKIEGLNVYPCLLPAQDCRVQDLMQVIEIATGT